MRYAIVRVDKWGNYLNSCPAGFEEINNDFVCSYKKSKERRRQYMKEYYKKKIKEATESRLMIDEKGNLKEIK